MKPYLSLVVVEVVEGGVIPVNVYLILVMNEEGRTVMRREPRSQGFGKNTAQVSM